MYQHNWQVSFQDVPSKTTGVISLVYPRDTPTGTPAPAVHLPRRLKLKRRGYRSVAPLGASAAARRHVTLSSSTEARGGIQREFLITLIKLER